MRHKNYQYLRALERSEFFIQVDTIYTEDIKKKLQNLLGRRFTRLESNPSGL